jgi:primosomal protein N' (replication factor Y)
MAAAALVVPQGAGGRVVVMAPSDLPVVQALVRWDPVGHAAAELASRAEVGFPPAVRMAAVEGQAAAVAGVVDHVEKQLGAGVEVLGPVEIEPDPRAESTEPEERALLRVRRTDGRSLASALHAAQAARTARKATDLVRVRLDPSQIG